MRPDVYTYAHVSTGTGEIRQWWTFRLETHNNLQLSPRDTASMSLMRSLQYHTFLDKLDHDNLVNTIAMHKARKK